MRTLSARILLGFAALAIAFGAMTVDVVVNLTIVEDSIHTIRVGHLPLALAANALARRQEDVKSYLADGISQDNSFSASTHVRGVRGLRDEAVKGLIRALDNYKKELDIPVPSNANDKIDDLSKTLDNLKPTYDLLIAALAKNESQDAESITGALQKIRDGERRVLQDTTDLATLLQGVVTKRTERLESQEHESRTYAALLGVIAIAITIMISVWVVITLRPLRRLRDAAKRVAAGDYGNRIEDKGPSEVAELAREFNSMAYAIQEREQQLVRSERLAAVSKLASMITHEIRNPLSAIGLNAELLEDELEGNAEGRALCQVIHAEVDRLTAITEDYLSFGNLPKPKIASEHVNAIVDALASFVRADLAHKQVELAVEFSEDPIALVDSAQLRQCLINLVRNASEAVSVKGGGKVTLRTRRAGDRVVIEVEDTGVGIAPEVLPRLFDTFFSTKAGGSGLGLALTHQIVKDHGGDLDVASTVGKGTTFTVSIPRG